MAVYFMRAGAFGDVKIGVANNPLARQKQLQTGVSARLRIVRIVDGGRAEEKLLHAKFSNSRKTGEWFSFHESMLGDIGLRDLPIPRGKRRGWQPTQDTPNGQFWHFIADLIEYVGGDDVLARALGVEPWNVHHLACSTTLLPGLVLLARQQGCPVSLPQAVILRDKSDREEERDRRRVEIARDAEENRRREIYWRDKHGSEAPWWDTHLTYGPFPLDEDLLGDAA